MKQAPSRDDPGPWSTFEAEVLPHADRLFRLAMWLERNRDDAEDLVQETMVQALRSFHRFQPDTNCRAWLVTILQRTVSNRRRARGRSILVSDPDDRIAESAAFVPPVPQQLTDELLLDTLRRLPEPYQQVIVLCDVEELSYKEAAEALAIPIGTVMSRLHRGRAHLRAELAGLDLGASERPTERRARELSRREDRGDMICRDVRERADSFLSNELPTERLTRCCSHRNITPYGSQIAATSSFSHLTRAGGGSLPLNRRLMSAPPDIAIFSAPATRHCRPLPGTTPRSGAPPPWTRLASSTAASQSLPNRGEEHSFNGGCSASACLFRVPRR